MKKKTDYIELFKRLTHSKDGSVDYKIFIDFLRHTGTINNFKYLIDEINDISLNNVEKSEYDEETGLKLKLNMYDKESAQTLSTQLNKTSFTSRKKEYAVKSQHSNGRVTVKLKPIFRKREEA